jgi:hypothetical protein
MDYLEFIARVTLSRGAGVYCLLTAARDSLSHTTADKQIDALDYEPGLYVLIVPT